MGRSGQQRIHYDLSADLRAVRPSSEMSFALIAPRLKRKRRMTLAVRQSGRIVYGAVSLVLLIALGIGMYLLFNNFSRPVSGSEEVVNQPTALSTAEVGQPEVNSTAEVGEPNSGIPGGELKWKFKTGSRVESRPPGFL